MVQEFGKHPSQGTEDLPIRLQYHEGWMLTEALSGRDGRPSEISVCEWKHDWFHLLRCNHGSSTVLCAQSLLLFCALFWMSQDETTGVGFIFVWFVVFFLRNHKTLLCAWVLTSYVLVAVLLAPAKFSLEIYATSHLTINQVKKI